MRVLFIDNLDSFTFNLVHCMLVAGVEVEVLRNEGEDWPELAEKMADCDALRSSVDMAPKVEDII